MFFHIALSSPLLLSSFLVQDIPAVQPEANEDAAEEMPQPVPEVIPNNIFPMTNRLLVYSFNDECYMIC